MKKIESLISDIHKVLKDGVEFTEEQLDKYSKEFARVLKEKLDPAERKREAKLRMSSIGKPCNRQGWYEINEPDKAEEFHPNVYMKFLIGDITEVVLLMLAELSGHKVEGQQDEVELYGIKGHRDAVIDGTTTDAKSASPFSFLKFENHLKPDDDSFGYLTQIQSYIETGKNDPIVTDKDRGAFLVLQKVTGDITLDFHPKQEIDFRSLYEDKKEIMGAKEPPLRAFNPEPYGKSGNESLGFNCSYCVFKRRCWPNLRVFLYGGKPVYFTKVKREPKVPELINGEWVKKEEE